MTDESASCHDWNTPAPDKVSRPVPLLHDETLRDGLQNPSVVDPPIEVKIEVLHLLAAVGVDSVNVGLPAAGPRTYDATLRLSQEIAEHKLPMKVSCAGRTVIRDLEPMADIAQKTGLKMEAMTFIGSSPMRQYVEGWSLDLIRERSVDAIDFAVREGMDVTYVTEDTTRTPPATLDKLFRAAIEAGAARLCLCDTVGHATPDGSANLVRWTRKLIDEMGVDVGVDWHGHNDRGFALANTLSAYGAGADRLHGCVLGLGERVGNAALEMLILNLGAAGVLEEGESSSLEKVCRLVADELHTPIPTDHPLVGSAGPRRG